MKYLETEQRFGVGDIAMLENKFKVKILQVFQEEDNSYWYEVEGLDLSPFARSITREVPQKALQAI